MGAVDLIGISVEEISILLIADVVSVVERELLVVASLVSSYGGVTLALIICALYFFFVLATRR